MTQLKRVFSDFQEGLPESMSIKLKGPLNLAKFAIANIGQVPVQVFTQDLVQVFNFSGIFINEKLFFHSSYAVLTCTRKGRNSFTSDFNNY